MQSIWEMTNVMQKLKKMIEITTKMLKIFTGMFLSLQSKPITKKAIMIVVVQERFCWILTTYLAIHWTIRAKKI